MLVILLFNRYNEKEAKLYNVTSESKKPRRIVFFDSDVTHGQKVFQKKVKSWKGLDCSHMFHQAWIEYHGLMYSIHLVYNYIRTTLEYFIALVMHFRLVLVLIVKSFVKIT